MPPDLRLGPNLICFLPFTLRGRHPVAPSTVIAFTCSLEKSQGFHMPPFHELHWLSSCACLSNALKDSCPVYCLMFKPSKDGVLHLSLPGLGSHLYKYDGCPLFSFDLPTEENPEAMRKSGKVSQDHYPHLVAANQR